MLFEIDFHSGVPIYRQVMDQVRKQIMTGLLRPGEQLETVRDLAARLKVNPMTVSKAYSLLETEGMIERKRGVGLFAAPVNREKAAQVKTEIIDSVLSKAAITAIQLDLSESQALELFREYYRQHDSKRSEK